MRETELARQLFDVIPHTMNGIRHEVRGLAKPDLPVPQFRVLVRLSMEPSNNSRLAEWMGVSLPAMSRMVDGLVRRGLVARSRAGSDRRQVQLALTAKGRACFERIWTAAQGKFAHQLAALSPGQKQSLEAGLAVLQEMFP